MYRLLCFAILNLIAFVDVKSSNQIAISTPPSQKSRGKRKKAVTDASEEGADEVEEGDEHHPKRAKEANDDEPMDPKASAYLKEMQTYNERHVGDERRSRPLVKWEG